jgi:ubiquinone/menaquinone biosynthesis C-methylase UbiE
MSALHNALHRLAGSADGSSGAGAENYDRLPTRLLGPLYRRVVDDLIDANLPAGAVVLDVGTGPGRLLIELARRRPDLQLIGIDPSPHMLALARKNLNAAGIAGSISLRAGTAAALPVDDSSVDVAVSTVTMHHWPNIGAGVRELERTLGPSGQLLIYDFRFVSSAPLEQGTRTWNPPVTPQRSAVWVAPWLPVPLFTRYQVAAGS